MKSQSHTQHLTDVEFSDLLAGEPAGTTVQAHLEACDHCRAELSSVRSSMGSFHRLGTEWAAAAAPVKVPVPSRWALGFSGLPSWSTGLAMTALTGVLVFNYGSFVARTSHSAGAMQPAVAMAPAPPSNAELAEDNRLMLSIDQELTQRAQPAVSAHDLRPGEHHTAQHGPDAVLD